MFFAPTPVPALDPVRHLVVHFTIGCQVPTSPRRLRAGPLTREERGREEANPTGNCEMEHLAGGCGTISLPEVKRCTTRPAPLSIPGSSSRR